jgi:cytochrome c oxidase assembly protein subunit 15
MSAVSPTTHHRAIAAWLLTVCALIFAMVVLGGVTRLTRSGLSIAEWDPIMGAIPPLTHDAWEALFEKYRQTPEYLKVNVGMDLAGFKGIFWLEYFHRLLGRLIGFVFLVPFLYFLARRRIERALTPKLVTMFVLGGLQGLLGWLMVASGLVDMPRVSPYRLTAHLGLAIAIYAYVLWVALGLLYPRGDPGATHAAVRRAGIAISVLVFVTILAGGFVAGTRAGFVFNDFPYMHGKLIPGGLYAMQPLWADVFENVATVQFHHRLLAYALAIVVPAYWWYARRYALAPRARLALHTLLAAAALQIALGIATLMYVVPLPLAAAHQAGALAVFTLALYLNHALGR